jgi:hypothetical protein
MYSELGSVAVGGGPCARAGVIGRLSEQSLTKEVGGCKSLQSAWWVQAVRAFGQGEGGRNTEAAAERNVGGADTTFYR